jgi:2-methylfumaryl-CoA isomerase
MASFGYDFATVDGQRVMVVALTQRHWRHLVELTGLAEVIGALERSLGVDLKAEEARYQHREVLSALMAPWFSQRTFEEAAAALDPSGVLWGRYRTVEQFVNEPDSPLRAGDLMVEVDQPGIGPFPIPRSVLRMGAWSQRSPEPAPVLGQHTDEVLRRLLGLGDAELDDLRSRGVIGGSRR